MDDLGKLIQLLLGHVTLLTIEHDAIGNVLLTEDQRASFVVEFHEICARQGIDPASGMPVDTKPAETN